MIKNDYHPKVETTTTTTTTITTTTTTTGYGRGGRTDGDAADATEIKQFGTQT